MNVYITIDIETYTGNYDLDVFGFGKGLEYIVTALEKHNIKGTFFVEALGATQWGLDSLKKVIKFLKDHKQDIQLHVHPSLFKNDRFLNKGDRLWSYDRATQTMLIEAGINSLNKCGVDKITAFRAGDLAANKDTLDAMRELGLMIGSNRSLDEKSSVKSLVNICFPIYNDISKDGNIVDLPVTSLRSPYRIIDGEYRHMQICALSALEITDTLERMAKSGYCCATILTHPGEFFYLFCGKTYYNRKNCRRFEKLLSYINNKGDMNASLISSCLDDNVLPKKSPKKIKLNLLYSTLRIFEQAISRLKFRLLKLWKNCSYLKILFKNDKN